MNKLLIAIGNQKRNIMKKLNQTLNLFSILIILLFLAGCENKGKKQFVAMSTPDMIAAQRQLRALQLSDPHRPTYHFVNPEGQGMPFDPNGAIYWKGRYHLFYIFQDHNSHSWGHASSRDLLHWRFHPTALFPGEDDPDRGIFSGNAFVTKDGEVAILYHGVRAGNSIALSNDDDLNNWTKLKSNPIIPIPEKGSPEEKLYSSWDPHGWIENGDYYAIFGGKKPSLFKASTIDDWQYVGPLLASNMPDVDEAIEDLSCPDFFTLGNKHALLSISHSHGARIYLGDWKDNQFYPESHQRMNWLGGTNFAPETLLDNRGRRIMWAWVLDRREKLHIQDLQEAPPYGWSGTMTLPRVLSLASDGTLLIQPVEELKQLRTNPRVQRNIEVGDGLRLALNDIEGTELEIAATVDMSGATTFGLKVMASPGGEEETIIEFNRTEENITIDFAKSSQDTSIKHYKRTMNFMTEEVNPIATNQVAPFKLGRDEELKIQIFIDRSIIEVFANGRQCVTQRVYPTRPDSRGVELFSKGGDSRVSLLRAWDVSPTNHW